jgi:hypothetical protein
MPRPDSATLIHVNRVELQIAQIDLTHKTRKSAMLRFGAHFAHFFCSPK